MMKPLAFTSMKKLGAALTCGSIAAIAALGACGDDETAASSGNAGCAPTNPACPALAVQSDCLSLVDNSGKDRFALRLSQLSVSAPTALTGQVVYNIIADGININLESCNVSGMGTFSMMAEFNKANGQLTLGGAFPEADPTNGYCYVYDPVNDVEPITVQSNLNADGTFQTETIARVTVPIFLDATATTAVYLPLSNGRFTGGQVSADQNCVGSFNASGLDPKFNCAPDPGAGIEYFINGASLEGFIALEDADSVTVDLLGQSLCVLLSGDAKTYGDGGMPVERCARDAMNNIILEGDWCLTTDSAGGCADAFVLKAELAASGAALRSDCPGNPTGGGGMGGTGGTGGAGGAGGN
jgi:hypothetical protein